MSEKLALYEVLAGLDAEDEKLIRLRFFEGKTQSDTARLMKTTQISLSQMRKTVCGSPQIRMRNLI